MIFAHMTDGTRRVLDQAKSVKLVWTEEKDGEEIEHVYDLADVEKFLMVEPMPMVKAGLAGGTIPVVGLVFRDTSDFAVEIPLAAAGDWMEQFLRGVAEETRKARTLAERVAGIGGRGKVEVARSITEALGKVGRGPGSAS